MNNDFEGGNDNSAHNAPTSSSNPFESDPGQAARSRNLSREAAGWRVKFRAAEAELLELKTKLASYEARSQPVASSAQPPLAREVSEAEAPRANGAFAEDVDADPLPQDAAELLALRDELRAAVLEKTLAEFTVMPDVVRDLLAARGILTFSDEAQPALVLDGQPVPLTYETLSRVVDPRLMKSAGVPGSGSRAGNRSPVSGFDFERGLRDPQFFRLHAKEMRAELARRSK